MRSLKKTVILKVKSKAPDRASISFAAKVLKKGGLVAFPTETVYGLAANLLNKKAIDRLYKVKRRPRNKPFTVHISKIDTIRKMGCVLTKEARALINEFWPGPLTIILKSKGGRKIGFRMPDHRIAAELIESAGVPVVAPSANVSGQKPPANSREVLKYLDGKIDILLDGGRTRVGVESTVIDLSSKPPKILREGAIKKEEIARVIGNG